MSTADIHLDTEVARLILHPGEIIRIRRGRFRVRVLRGVAWLTQNGHDHLVPSPGQTDLAARADPAILSGVGGGCLSVELRRA